MTTDTEKKAEKYLCVEYSSPEIHFEKSNEDKFDLWIIREGSRSKGELKASNGKFNSNSDIAKNLIFNTHDEKVLFENGETEIVRVFLGDKPPTVFIVNNHFISNGANFEHDHRYIIKGRRNYGSDSVTNISSSNK